MKKIAAFLFILIPTFVLAQEREPDYELEGYKFSKPQKEKLPNPDQKKFDHVENLEGKYVNWVEPQYQFECDPPEPTTYGPYITKSDPDMTVEEPDYKTHTVFVYGGQGHWEHTATECNKDCIGQPWTPVIVASFRSYIEYLGLSDEEFQTRYTLKSSFTLNE